MAPLGIVVEPPTLDLAAMMKHKDDTVAANVNGVAFLFKKNKIDWLQGRGPDRRARQGRRQGAKTAPRRRSRPRTSSSPPAPTSRACRAVEIDEKRIVSSTGALALPKCPKQLIVIGAGVIGLELGSVWRRLGAEVTVVEFLDRILPGMDGEIGKQFQRLLKKQGIKFKLGTRWRRSRRQATGVKATIEPAAGGDAQTLEADVVLVAIGRRPYTEASASRRSASRRSAARSWSTTTFRPTCPASTPSATSSAGPMLAHKAEDEGVAVAEILAGQAGHVNYDAIPAVVYTSPEIASVGKTEEELKAAGVAYKVGKFPFTANGRARAMRHTEGFVKILADAADRPRARRATSSASAPAR